MDRALDTITGEIITSEELWGIETIDQNRYCCPGCGINMIPEAYNRKLKLRPYFSKPEGVLHTDDCRFNIPWEQVNKAKKKSLKTAKGFLYPFPDRLILKKEQAIVADNKLVKAIHNSVKTEGEGLHPYSVESIRSIVKHYIDFPNDRDLLLDIPGTGSEQNDYQTLFKKVPDNKLIRGSYVFYDRLHNSKMQLNDNELIIQLISGEWNDLNVQVQPNFLHIDISAWSEDQINIVKKEFEVSRYEEKESIRFRENKKRFVFFLGEQDLKEKHKFTLKDYRHICCLTIEKNWYYKY